MPRRYTGGFLSGTEQVTDANSASGIFTVQEAGALTAAGQFPSGRWTPQNSLRFKTSANTYLRRTPATVSNRKTFTISVWFKVSTISATLIITEASDATGTSVRSPFRIQSGGGLQFSDSGSGADYVTTMLFRDPAAWYHAVLAVDTTQSLASERIKIYINGVRQTSFSTSTAATLNADTLYNSPIHMQNIGSGVYWSAQAFDGYMSEFNQIDGQALDPSYFAATDPQTGAWVPKRYTGTYGTNGFYLPFNNNPPDSSAVDVLVVAGGGGGGSTAGGGGGGGGFREVTLAILPSTAYTVTVGAGGPQDTAGNDSVFSTVTSAAGGKGGAFLGGGTTTAANSAGGSGGGAGGRGLANNTQPGGTATAYQGNTGGNSLTSSYGGGGGGGGAGAAGSTGGSGGGGAGGAGKVSVITGSTYAGGGGGGIDNGIGSYGSAGSGGAGAGGGPGGTASANTGSGGGGGSNPSGATGGTGGSGIVVLKYPNTRTITIGVGLTGSTSTSGSFKITTITQGTGTVSFA